MILSTSKLTSNFFRDIRGKIIVVQFPNPPLMLWGIATIVGKLFGGTIQTFSGYIAFVSIFVWAVLEIYSGASLFRKLLGVSVLVIVLANRL